jgi:hypothetical protein
LFIVFPGFESKAILGESDIYLDATPYNSPTSDSGSDGSSMLPSLIINNSIHCRHTTQQQIQETPDNIQLDNVLKTLRQYYSEVKTKRQLNLNLLAGFRQDNTTQQNFKEFLRPTTSSTGDSPTSNNPDSLPILNSVSENTIERDCIGSSSERDTGTLPTHSHPSSVTNLSSVAPVPILRCIDKPSTPLPSWLTFTEDYIRVSMGFYHIDTVKKHLYTLYALTVALDQCPADAILDTGDVATLHKSPRNTTPIIRPTHFGDVIHMDIVFWSSYFCGKHALWSLIHGLLQLHDLYLPCPKSLGFSPKRLIRDFDTKLIGGNAREFLNSLSIHVNAAPAYRQDKNGLAERHWQTVVTMATNWLASAELPATFWYYVVKRATEICNYFPLQSSCGKWTTPLELAHGVKPDLRVLFKPFSVAVVRRKRHGDNHLGKFDSQSLPMIAVR